MAKKLKLYYSETDSFTVYIKTDDVYKKIAEHTRPDTSSHVLDRPRPLAKGKSKKVIGLMTDELGRKILKEFIGLRAKPIVS